MIILLLFIKLTNIMINFHPFLSLNWSILSSILILLLFIPSIIYNSFNFSQLKSLKYIYVRMDGYIRICLYGCVSPNCYISAHNVLSYMSLCLSVHILLLSLENFKFETTDQSTNQPIDQPTDRPIDRPTDRPINQPTNQPTNWWN